MKTMKSGLAILLAIFLMASVAFLPPSLPASVAASAVTNVWDGTTASAYAGGDGSQADPYQISNGAQLDKMHRDVKTNAYYIITADIYLNDVSDSDWKDHSPHTWASVSTYFSGTVDGAGHTVYGLYTDGSYYDFGLITRIYGESGSTYTTTVHDLTISDCYVNCTATAPSGQNPGVGAFVGFLKGNSYLRMSNCYATDSVYLNAVKGVGTFCGYGSTKEITLENCATFAHLSAGQYCGALSGGAYSAHPTFTGCIAGAVDANANGLPVNAKTGVPFRSVNSYTICTSEVNTCESGTLTVLASRASMTGSAAAVNMPALDWNTVWETTAGFPVLRKNTPVEVEPENPVEGLGESWEDFAADSYAGGSGTQNDPYQIATAAQLAHLIKDSATSGKYYIITSDIQLNRTARDGFGSKRNWIAATAGGYSFAGHLDGKNHVISGLYYYNGNVTASLFCALIPRTVGGDISNIILKNSSISMACALSGSDFSAVAGIVGYANGNTSVNNCYVEKTVSLKNIAASYKNAQAGGIIGAGNRSIYIDSCAFFGTISVSSNARYGSMFGDVWSSTSTYTKQINRSIAANYTPSNNYAFTGSDNIFEVASSKTSSGYVVSGVECDTINREAVKRLSGVFYLTGSGYPKPCGTGGRFCDVDGDLQITSLDLVSMVRLLLETDSVGCVNVNGDDSADILDLIFLKKKLAANISVLDTYHNVPEDIEEEPEPAVSISLKSVTVTMYDVANHTYGVTWNSSEIPLEPVVQVCESPVFDEEHITEYAATYSQFTSYSDSSTTFPYYVSKAIIPLDPGKTYTYRAYDRQKIAASKTGKITTQDHDVETFTFMHFSDSQVSGSSETNPGTSGSHFEKALAAAIGNEPNTAFAVHTGDIVEWSKYEAYWENMLDTYNSSYFMSIPFMPISGNHETTYRSGNNETFKHFNLNLPSQDTEKGIYYSFDYGNVRFIMLNTNRVNSDKTLTSDQYNWLVSALNSRPASIKWTVVTMHCPMYSVGTYGSDPSKNAASVALKNQLSALFAEKGVDLVLQGHDHEYSKTKPIVSPDTVDTSYTTESINGIPYDVDPAGPVYAMHGPAGSQQRSPYETVNESLYDYFNTSSTYKHSFAKIEVDADKLTVSIMYENNGTATTVYRYGIKKQ